MLNETKVVVTGWTPRSFTQGLSANVPVGVLETRVSSGSAASPWVPVSLPGNGGLVLGLDPVGHVLGLRFVPAIGFNGTVTFEAVSYNGSIVSGQTVANVATGGGTRQYAFDTVVPARNVPPILDAALSTAVYPPADEDPLLDSAGKSLFLHSIDALVCPRPATACYYRDALGRTGGAVVVGVDTRYGAWSWRCCPRTFVSTTDGCPASVPFAPVTGLDNGMGLALHRHHCELRFVSTRDFNTEINPITGQPRSASDRPFVQLRAWDGSYHPGQSVAAGRDRSWDARLVNVTHELAQGDNSVVGSTVVAAHVDVRNIVDVPYLNVSAAHIVFTDGDTTVPLATTSAGLLRIVDPDFQGTTSLTIDVQGAGDAVQYTLPSGITVTPGSATTSCTGRCTLYASGSLPTQTSTVAFNDMLSRMQYRPGGSNFSRSLPNRTVVVTANDDSLQTTITVAFVNPNLRPTVSVSAPIVDANDMQPLRRVVVADDDNVITRATVTVLNATGGGVFAFASQAGFAIQTSVVANQVMYAVSSGQRNALAWQRFLRGATYTGPYPQRVQVEVEDAVQRSLNFVVLYTSALS